jgi:hypothetical protein
MEGIWCSIQLATATGSGSYWPVSYQDWNSGNLCASWLAGFKIGAGLRQEYGNHSRGLPFGGGAFSHLGNRFGVHLVAVIDGITNRPDHQGAVA